MHINVIMFLSLMVIKTGSTITLQNYLNKITNAYQEASFTNYKIL